jgi:hypothetical protein
MKYSNYLSMLCIMWILIQTVFVQFVHYDSQYRNLDPNHYNVEVITQEDYKQLSIPGNLPIKLSTGKTISNRSEAFYTNSLPKYKSVNNDSEYVLVTVKGTAPFVHIWYSGAVPILAICVFSLFRNKYKKED